MSSIDEKRVYGPNTGATALFVASETGLARVTVVGERFGEIELVNRRAAHDLAVSDGRLAVATDEDVRVTTAGTLDSTGFGPASAVGFVDETLLAAGPDGRVARRADGDWHTLGTVEGVRAIDGDLLATAEGVYRLSGEELRYAGLEDVNDVAVDGTPHAASATGLYQLGNGWMETIDGEFAVVSIDPEDPGTVTRAHAATTDTLYEYADGEWVVVEGVGRAVADVAYAEGVHAVCTDGTLYSNVGEGWRDHPLGLHGVRAVVAVPPDRKPV